MAYPSSNDSKISSFTITTNADLTVTLFKIFTNATFYYLTPFIPLGILFNILILLVFGRSGLGTTKTTRIYYLVMAWGELGTVIFKDLWFFALGIGVTEVFKANPIGVLNVHVVNNPFLCSFLWFIWYIHEMAANNAFVVFEFERVFALYMPLQSLSFNTQRKALGIMLVDIALSTLLSATIFGYAKFQEVVSLMPFGTFCFFASYLGTWSIIPVVVFLANYILPAFLSIASTVLISAKIWHRSRNRGSLCASAYSADANDSGSIYSTSVSSGGLSRREISVCGPQGTCLHILSTVCKCYVIGISCRRAGLHHTAYPVTDARSFLCTSGPLSPRLPHPSICGGVATRNVAPDTGCGLSLLHICDSGEQFKIIAS